MRVLWITYITFPESLNILNNKELVNKGSGGWLLGAAEALLSHRNVELRIASITRSVTDFHEVQKDNKYYYLIPWGRGVDKYHTGYDHFWKKISLDYKPDIVHIHGIESILPLSFTRACGRNNVVVSIQGIKSVIAKYYCLGIKKSELYKNLSFGDILRCKTIFGLRNDFAEFSKYEDDIAREIKFFIGRTRWDYSHIMTKNPHACYFHCNETLRHIFYEGQTWLYEKCIPHSIFVSAGSAPFKGLHFLLDAIRIVLGQFPDTSIYIAGSGNWNSSLKRTSYERLILSHIEDNNLQKHVHFVGPLSDGEMRDAYLKCNLFVCPSAIENSSNSVGEAQILGVPLVATFVGGMQDLVPNEECGLLVRFGESEMLAHGICHFFEIASKFDNKTMRDTALRRHNAEENSKRTINIYNYILNNK